MNTTQTQDLKAYLQALETRYAKLTIEEIESDIADDEPLCEPVNHPDEECVYVYEDTDADLFVRPAALITLCVIGVFIGLFSLVKLVKWL